MDTAGGVNTRSQNATRRLRHPAQKPPWRSTMGKTRDSSQASDDNGNIMKKNVKE
jgi:hypothetical protein